MHRGSRTDLGEGLFLKVEAAPGDRVHRERAAHRAAGVSDLEVTPVLLDRDTEATEPRHQKHAMYRYIFETGARKKKLGAWVLILLHTLRLNLQCLTQ